MKTTPSIRPRSRPSFHALAWLPLLAAASLHAQTVQPVQPVQNGSFENPGVNGQVAGAGNNWTVTGNPFVLSNNAGLGTTTYGNQWERLNAGSTVAQTLPGTLNLGQLYTLSLVAADVYGQGDQLTLTVSGAATASQVFTIPGHGFSSGALPFVEYDLSFTPTSTGNVTITLANTGTTNGLALDNVQVSVPEPSTWAAVAAGAGLLGFVALRRRSARRV